MQRIGTVDERQSWSVKLNGTHLQLDARNGLPSLKGVAFPAGELMLAPATMNFLALAGAHNGACPQQ